MLIPTWEPSRELRRRFAEARRYDWLLDRYFEAGTAFDTGTVDGIIEGEFARAASNFLASLLLCEKGFGLVAHQIARTHIEIYAGIKWSIKNPSTAPGRYSLWLRFAQHLLAQRTRQNPLYGSRPATVVLSAEELERAKLLFNSNCTAYWTGHRQFIELVREAGPPDEGEFERRRYEGYVRVVQTWSDRLTHAGPLATLSHVEKASATDVYKLLVGSSAVGVENAVLANGLPFSWILYTVFRRSRPDLLPLLDFANSENWHAWLTPLQQEKIARGGRCPCDEGRLPYRECHGQYRSAGLYDPLAPPWSTNEWPPHAYEETKRRSRDHGLGGPV
jgi:hypothetical protein